MPKRVPPLSAKSLDAVRPSNEPIELVDGYIPGLRVRIYPTGGRSWSLNIRDSKGKRARFDVGNGLGLAEARRKADHLRREIKEGKDPTAEKRAARQRAEDARNGIGTVGALIDGYFTAGPGSHHRRSGEEMKLVMAVFQPALHEPLQEIDRAQLQLLADKWRSAATASLAVRLLRPCLKWAIKRDLARAGVADIEPPAKIGKRDRTLNKDELRSIWLHLNGAHGSVMRWLLWTGCRLNEAAEMRRGEIVGGDWTIPAARAKSGRQRTVPLPHQAREYLRQRQQTGAGNSVASGPDALVFPSKRGGILSNWDRETKRIQKTSGTSGWHRHDLRRTVATMLGDLGFDPHVIGVVLGHAHVAEGATAIYARSRYHREHREALQALADEIDLLLSLGCEATQLNSDVVVS